MTENHRELLAQEMEKTGWGSQVDNGRYLPELRAGKLPKIDHRVVALGAMDAAREVALEECALIADRHIVSTMSNAAYDIGREIRALKTSTSK